MCFAFTNIAFAKKYALILGGSGEDFKESNFFLPGFEKLNTNLKQRGFDVQILFDRAKTQNKFVAETLTTENINKKLEELFSIVTKDDQVAIIIHTHGSPQNRDFYFTHTPGHPILTESGDYETANLIKYLNKSKAKIAVADFSCYSGQTQTLIEQKYSKAQKWSIQPISSKTSNSPCVITESSPNYVSVCSGDPASNSFTDAFISNLSGTNPINAENLFRKSRLQDSSFTNIPHISSRPKALFTDWNSWLANSDPAGIRDNEFSVMHLESDCSDCKNIEEKFLSEKSHSLSQELKIKSAAQLLTDYEKLVLAQREYQKNFEAKVVQSWKSLLKKANYSKYKNLSFELIMFIAEAKNVPGLKTKSRDKDAISYQEFTQGFQYFDNEKKTEIMNAMDDKVNFQNLVKDLKQMTEKENLIREKNRKKIKDSAKNIIAYERQSYEKNFTSPKGNSCQKFVF